MKKWQFKLCNITLIFTTIILFTFTFNKSSNAQTEHDQLIMFTDSKISNEVNQFLEKKYPDLKKTVIPEIAVVKLEETNNKQYSKAISEIKRKFHNEIESIGPESKIINPKESSLNAIISKEEIVPSSTQNIEEKAKLYEVLGWDIKKITEDGKSFKKQKGNHNVKIALIDSGIDFNHPDLKDNIISKGKSFVPNIDNTDDNMGHGTMAAGSIAANGNMLGVGPNLGIIPYKVMDNWQDGAESAWVTQAIIAAANDGVDVINLSLGTYKSLNKPEDQVVIESYKRAVKYAHKRGVIVVASAGNESLDNTNPALIAEKRGFSGDMQVHLPGGGVPSLLTVSATDKDDLLSSYSNYGGISVAAPAGDYGPEWATQQKLDPFSMTLTTYPTNLPQPPISKALNLPEGYVLMAGTSVAAPKVSGAVGVLIAEQQKSGRKPLTLAKLEKILKNSSTDLGAYGKDPKYGYGLINVNKALEFIK
ncbi:S8 family serine peptidase [Bacillus cereus]|uniref:BacP protein n=1 Tax=Bacillus cereus VPC1401 TaxID=870739 RepID=E5AK47_BACCE|nr:S8 family serine peptidase [Bacillus cereus]MDZ4588735.1 S8 family serine peptidase [Bacillus cereus]MDZ4599792.1 S8 family serine peptidase [Bacillus cereus]WPA86271.1 S8 family serine peptidase [Bacillus cereus]CBW44187.1 BacP protein [Bacillus cereus VPC1401]